MYPTWTSGDVITSRRLLASRPLTAVKRSEQECTVTTESYDDALFIDVEANAVYEVSMGISAIERTGTNGDITIQYATPFGSRNEGRGGRGPQIGVTSTTNTTAKLLANWWAAGMTYGVVAGSSAAITEDGILVTGPNPGRLHLMWTKATSSTAVLVVQAGGYLRAVRIA